MRFANPIKLFIRPKKPTPEEMEKQLMERKLHEKYKGVFDKEYYKQKEDFIEIQAKEDARIKAEYDVKRKYNPETKSDTGNFASTILAKLGSIGRAYNENISIGRNPQGIESPFGKKNAKG